MSNFRSSQLTIQQIPVGRKVLLYLTDTANNITKVRIISESIFHTFCHFCLSTMRIIVFGGNLYNKEAQYSAIKNRLKSFEGKMGQSTLMKQPNLLGFNQSRKNKNKYECTQNYSWASSNWIKSGKGTIQEYHFFLSFFCSRQ